MPRFRQGRKVVQAGGGRVDRDGLTEFSGLGGSVVRGVFGPGSLVNGICVAFLLFGGAWTLQSMGADVVVAPYADAIIALALARFSLNGLAGERRGTILSTAGAGWGRVAAVAARYLALTALWLVPLLLLGFRADQIQGQAAAAAMGLGGGPRLVGLLILLGFGMAVSPPIFLIVATRAETFADIARPDHWRRLFAGRLGDLLVVYVLYAGGVAAALGVSLPIVVAAFMGGRDPGVIATTLVLVFAGGLAVTLLGRLCGFYAFGETGDVPVEKEAPAGPAPARAAEPRSAATARPPATPARAAGHAAPSHATTGHAVAGHPPAGQAATGGAHHQVEEAGAAHPPGKPALLDATQRAEEARRRFGQDPAGAIASLEELRATHAPSPQVLHALCLLLYQSGRAAEALAVAREAIPVCLERGSALLAAEIFRHAAANLKELDLGRDHLLLIASVLLKSGGLGHAANLYASVLRAEPAERRAVKGLLQVADLKQREPAGVPEAIKIYRYLLHRCPDSPLADDMRRGLAEAETRLARAS